MTLVENLTHDEIAEIGARWLRGNGYPVAFSNMRSSAYGEQPDALGLNAYADSFLLEAKISRSDFLSDKNKPWRQHGKEAIGDSRGYITPKGLLKIEEIPYGWWLLEVHGKNKPIVKVIKGIVTVRDKKENGHFSWPYKTGRNCEREEMRHFSGSCRKSITNWMIKITQRAALDGVDLNKYAQKT